MAKAPTKLRCSSLDQLIGCAPAVLLDGPGTIRISSATPAAALGSACHDALADYVSKGEYDIEQSGDSHGLSYEAKQDALGLIAYGVRAYGELGKYFPKPQVEAQVAGPVLKVGSKEFVVSGTIDLCSPGGANKAVFLDWKSGYLDDGYLQQMAGYAYLLWCFMERPEDIEITGVIVFLRHRYYRVLKYNAKILKDWEHDLAYNVLPSPDKYRPGKHCRFCELALTCKARQAVVSGTIGDIMGDIQKPGEPGWLDRGKEIIAQLTEDNKSEQVVGEILADMVFRTRLCQQAIDNTKSLLKDAVARVGPIPVGNGMALCLREIEVKRLKPVEAMQVLRNYLSDTQICEGMKLSLPSLLKKYAEQQQGTRKESREHLEAKLSEGGAITISRQTRLEEAMSADVGLADDSDTETPDKEHKDGDDSN